MTESVLQRGQLKKELYAFLIITFAATYILQLGIYVIAGPLSYTSPFWIVTLSASMFIPAIVAIFCMAYFKSKAMTTETKIIFTFFLIYVVLFLFESFFQPIIGNIMGKPLLSGIIGVLGILTLIILNLKKKWRNGLELSKLSFGKNLRYYIIIPLIFSAILIITPIFYHIYGLGSPSTEFNLYMFFNTWIPSLILFFFILWPSYFGEEYGWRGYLQDRLFPLLGGYKGVLILGIIWGLWHSVLIVLGHNYPGYPILGNVLMVIYCIVLGTIFSYAVLKTGSIWIAVILHLINNKTAPVATSFIANSDNLILGSFIGIAFLAVFVLVLLKSKVWKITEKIAFNE
ncbi:MAG: type II CAAX endopeptidase family protein [Methanobacteriaceae archaeon]|nr:type II CAAX endopeptidase family protein [Methanobacteriaceae archaeon]MDO9626080.1 type II CAAX endopeptidase family protein [Methanobacteriaceae archaeon]